VPRDDACLLVESRTALREFAGEMPASINKTSAGLSTAASVKAAVCKINLPKKTLKVHPPGQRFERDVIFVIAMLRLVHADVKESPFC